MGVVHRFESIGIFLAEDRFVPVLESVTVAFVPAIKAFGIPGQLKKIVPLLIV